MSWAAWLWTAVIPTAPLVVPGLNWVLWSAGLLLLASGAALLLERDRGFENAENPAAFGEGALGCAA